MERVGKAAAQYWTTPVAIAQSGACQRASSFCLGPRRGPGPADVPQLAQPMRVVHEETVAIPGFHGVCSWVSQTISGFRERISS